MRIAVISDIHGNEHALDVVCVDIANQKADTVLFLGDMISDFPHMTNAVLNKVKSLTDFVIQGNREGYMLRQHKSEFGGSWGEYKQFSTNLKTWQALSETDIRYMNSLPKQMSLMFNESFSLRMVHGSPFSEFDTIKQGEDDLLARSAAAVSEKILLCGHTHRPMVKEINDKIIVNVGSVGLNFDKDYTAQYTLINYNDGKIHIDMRKVSYDFAAFKKSCDLSNTWILLCIRSIEDGINYNVKFLEEAQEICNRFPIPNDVWDSLADEWKHKGIL